MVTSFGWICGGEGTYLEPMIDDIEIWKYQVYEGFRDRYIVQLGNWYQVMKVWRSNNCNRDSYLLWKALIPWNHDGDWSPQRTGINSVVKGGSYVGCESFNITWSLRSERTNGRWFTCLSSFIPWKLIEIIFNLCLCNSKSGTVTARWWITRMNILGASCLGLGI